jgi:DDE superfamily endonuclease
MVSKEGQPALVRQDLWVDVGAERGIFIYWETPIRIHAFNWSKMSVCAALGYRWDGRRSRLFFQTREGSYNSESLIRFLSDLRRDLGGQKAILIWDGLPAHKSRSMKEYLGRERHWLRVGKIAGLRTGPQSGGDAVGKYQRAGIG